MLFCVCEGHRGREGVHACAPAYLCLLFYIFAYSIIPSILPPNCLIESIKLLTPVTTILC